MVFEDRLRNQLRIHWNWLKESDAENMVDFIMAIFINESKKCDCGGAPHETWCKINIGDGNEN